MKSLPEANQPINLPAQQVQSLEFTKNLLQAVEQGDTMRVVRMEQKVSMDSAIQAVSINNVIKSTDENLVVSGLAGLILRTSGFFNLSKVMTEDQAIDTAYLLLEKYPYESFEDFVIMFRNAKMGKYGELYNRLDGQIIFKWMEEYMEEKAIHREKTHRAVKFGTGDEISLKTIQDKARQLETPEQPQNFKSVSDALKEAIGYENQITDQDKNEKDYSEFRKKYLIKK